MSYLEAKLRPWAIFDASNKQHREWFYKFLATHSWRHCPVRFAPGDEAAEMLGWIQKEMLIYYGRQEFGRAKKPKPVLVNGMEPLTLEDPKLARSYKVDNNAE